MKQLYPSGHRHHSLLSRGTDAHVRPRVRVAPFTRMACVGFGWRHPGHAPRIGPRTYVQRGLMRGLRLARSESRCAYVARTCAGHSHGHSLPLPSPRPFRFPLPSPSPPVACAWGQGGPTSVVSSVVRENSTFNYIYYISDGRSPARDPEKEG